MTDHMNLVHSDISIANARRQDIQRLTSRCCQTIEIGSTECKQGIGRQNELLWLHGRHNRCSHRHTVLGLRHPGNGVHLKSRRTQLLQCLRSRHRLHDGTT